MSTAKEEPGVRVGVDLVRVDDVAGSIERFGDRYVRRLFTEHEIESCSAAHQSTVASLAARFAAKEAVIKVLRPTGARPEWRSIEVRRGPEGACDLLLTGAAAQLAESAGLGQWSVSMSHEAGMAIALVAGAGPWRTEEERCEVVEACRR